MIQTLHNPNRVHKRTHFFKYTSASVAKIIFTTRTRRWSSPVLFNDPFDVHRELGPNVSPASAFQAGAQFYLDRIAEVSGIKLTPRIRAAFFEEITAEITNPSPAFLGFKEVTSVLKQFWREKICKLRILCLSERPDIASMWAHYSDNHRGVVFRFECSDFHDSPLLLAKPVKYSDELPSLATVEGWIKGYGEYLASGSRDIFGEYCYLKTIDWGTEREWRVVSFARAHEAGFYSDWPFEPSTLSEVIFGHKMDQQDRSDILFMLSNDFNHVRAFDVMLGAGNRFDFREVLIPRVNN